MIAAVCMQGRCPEKNMYLCYMQLTGKQIKQITDRLREAYPGVAFAYIFGSAAQNTMRQSSDIDLAVYLDLNVDKPALIAGIIGDVEDILHNRNCDLVILNEAEPLLAFEAISGRILFVRQTAIDTQTHD